MKINVYQFLIKGHDVENFGESRKINIIPYECVSTDNVMSKEFWDIGTRTGMTIHLSNNRKRGGISKKGMYVIDQPIDQFYHYAVISGQVQEIHCMSMNYFDRYYVVVQIIEEWVRVYQIEGLITREDVTDNFKCLTDVYLKFRKDLDEADDKLRKNILKGLETHPALYNADGNSPL